ncbi:MAG: glycosyl hydrolase family 28-related protein [Planctomycetota bacterium]
MKVSRTLSGACEALRYMLFVPSLMIVLFGGEILGQDRRPQVNCVYPDAAFLHAQRGGRILDVTKAPFHAKGDGKTDDTQALVKAYDYVLAEMDKYEWTPAGPQSDLPQYVVYLPDGTYLVSDTVIYSGPWRKYPGEAKGGKAARQGRRVFERLVRIRFIGQSREKTIIRLKDNCPGFGEAPKPVVSFGKSDLNNAVAYNTFRNITIHTGRGNDSAIGLEFCGANNSGIHNVAVVSGDGRGVAGIDIRISPSMGYHDDITVEGFDHGLRMQPYHMTHNSFEFVSLKGQRVSAVRVEQCSTSLRKVHTQGPAPAVELTTPAAQAVVLDSRFEGAGAETAAINAGEAHVFVRNVETRGYPAAIAARGQVAVEAGRVEEYVSPPILSLRQGQVKRSLGLPIEDSPAVPWETDLSQWANVDDFGARGDGETDDSAAVQAAMNSGKPVVFFNKSIYRLEQPVSVPKTVRRITAFYGNVDGTLSVAETGTEPLLIEDLSGRVMHDAPRTLVLSHVGGTYFNRTRAPGVKTFINNCNGFGKNPQVFAGGRYWVRFMNTEFKQAPNFTCNRSDMWVFGYKVEGRMTNFEVIGGGRLEVLGGICNEHGGDFSAEIPVLRNVDSSLCYVGKTNGPEQFDVIVEETRDGETRRLMHDDCPPRGGESWKNDVVIPMYVSFDPAAGPAPRRPRKAR